LTVGTPQRPETIAEAARRGDPVETERAAQRLGPSGLAHALASENPAVVKAALEAAPASDDPWTLLQPTTRPVASGEANVAPAAWRATRRIVAQLDPADPSLPEIPRDALAQVAATLALLAQNGTLPASHRAQALGILGMLAPFEPLRIPILEQALADPAAA